MAEDINIDILKESEYTVKIAKKELGKTLDYSVNSLKDLDSLIEHVKKHFLNLKNEGKLTDQTIQRASVSIGSYLGEVIRRTHGGTWTAKNNILKTLVINGKEVSPIRYVFDRLTKGPIYSLDKYWSDIIQLIQPQEKNKNGSPVPAISKKTNNLLMIIGVLLSGLAVLFCIGLSGVSIYSNVTRIPPTITPRPTATRVPSTSTPSIYTGDPRSYLPIMPDGFVIDNNYVQAETTLEDGTRVFTIGYTNNQAYFQGDLVSVIYFIIIYPSEAKAISGYHDTVSDWINKGDGVSDSEIEIVGADDSAIYFESQEDNIALIQYMSRVKNVFITTMGLSDYDPQGNTNTKLFIDRIMANGAEVHILLIDNIH